MEGRMEAAEILREVQLITELTILAEDAIGT
jgi:hypothetical protein